MVEDLDEHDQGHCYDWVQDKWSFADDVAGCTDFDVSE